MRTPGTDPSPVAQTVARKLAPFLGDFNAAIWIKSVARRDLGLTPEELEPEHLPALLDGLRPSLNTFLGQQAAGDLLDKILHEVS